MPDNSKKIFSLITAVVGTLVIVSLWFSFTRDTSVDSAGVKEESKLSSLSPMQVIKDEFGKAFSNFNEQMVSIKGSSTPPVEIVATALDIGTSTASGTDESTSTISEITNEKISTTTSIEKKVNPVTATTTKKVSTTSIELI